jgi:hypothetical protein
MHQNWLATRIIGMTNKFEKILKNTYEIEPPEGLFGKILARINLAKRRSATARAVFFGAVTVASLAVIIPIFQSFIQIFSQSSFYQYFSLIFSDGQTILLYWKEFALSLVESLPITELIILSSIIFILLGSIRLASKNLKVLFLSNPIA